MSRLPEAAVGSRGPRRRLWRRLRALRTRVWDRRRYGRLVLEDVDGLALVVLPDVFNPKLLRSGEFLVRQLQQQPGLLPPGATVLDLGCGSGSGALAAARAGCRVVAVDINPHAVRCTRINALLNQLESRVEARCGDLFGPLQGQRFDVVLFNPPYYRGVPRDPLDHAWRSPDVIERFAAELGDHLGPGGFGLMVLSSDGESASFLQALAAHGFDNQVVAEHDFGNELMWVYRLVPEPRAARLLANAAAGHAAPVAQEVSAC